MIRHVVLFRFIPEVTPQQVERLWLGIERLAEQVSSVSSLEQGSDFGGRADGFEHAVIVEFPDRDALDQFYASEAHTKLVETLIKPACEKIVAFDFDSSFGRPL